jgi:hypothetical protein
MTYVIHGGRQDPTLEYDVTDAASGTPMRITVATGVVALAFQSTGARIETRAGADPHHPMGFFVPGLPTWSGGDPLIVAELSLAQVGVFLVDIKASRLHGVGEVQGQAQPDPQRGGQRAVYLSFKCIGQDPMSLRYRVTLYRPRG